MNQNSVTPDQIAALHARVTIVFTNPEGTTSTFAHAFLDGRFYLDTGHSACVDPANFDAEKGKDYAAQSLEPKILNKLWQFEGYALYKQIAAGSQLSVDPEPVAADAAAPAVADDAAGTVGAELVEADPASTNEVAADPAQAATPSPVAPTAVTEEHVTAFLQYPLPEDVHPDVVPGSQSYGTHLLSWPQAKAMLEHVFSFGKKAEDPPADTWLDRLRAEQAELAGRVVKLNAFLDGHGAPTDTDEALLRRQASLMDQLDDVLLQRIARALATAPVPVAAAQETQA